MRGDERVGDRYDALIDRALRSYAEPGEVPEARVVLARVLERARAVGVAQAGGGCGAAAVAGGFAVMVLVGWIWGMRSSQRPEIAWKPKAPGVTLSATTQSPYPGMKANNGEENMPRRLKPEIFGQHTGTAEAVPFQNGRTAERESRAEAENHLPRMEVFPMPRPLSAEEQALVAFANDVPAKVQQQVIEAQKHVGDPIAIAELKIAPLDDGEKQDSNQREKDRER
jgi:hypothetical protein